MGFQTGSDCFWLSRANPIVGVCDVAMAPMILAISLNPPACVRRTTGARFKARPRPAGAATHRSDTAENQMELSHRLMNSVHIWIDRSAMGPKRASACE